MAVLGCVGGCVLAQVAQAFLSSLKTMEQGFGCVYVCSGLYGKCLCRLCQACSFGVVGREA
jgi:hypothetical protein